MKKIIVALAVLAAASMTSCVEEQSFNNHIVGKNEVAFVLQAGASTKAVKADSPIGKGVSIQIGEIGNQNIYLEETISDLNFVVPETKGTPVFTENVGTLYKDNLFVHSSTSGFEDTTFETMDDEMYPRKGSTSDLGWRYWHTYANDWPSDDVHFYLVMPADIIADDNEVGILDLSYNTSKPATSFTYLSPISAAEQHDIIVAGTTLNEETHSGYLPNGAPVTFYHALTAIKFAIGNTAAELTSKGIAITSVSFTGLANSGTCTVDPTATGDNPIVTWNASAAANNVISQSFTAEENVVTFDPDTDNNSFADSFYDAGNSQNVNKADASLTFWLIPQSFPSNSNAILRVSYTINNHPEYLDITLKDFFGSKPWMAGQLRTFTIKLDEVNVKITDEVSIAGNANNGYSGSKKQNIKIQNTGDTPAFIRAAIVGQWLDSEGNPVFGFTDEINQLYLVESWYEDQFVKTGEAACKHGVFTGLPGYQGAASFKADGGADATAGWQLCTDGYYYYTKIVEPTAFTGSSLFTSYETKIAPRATLAGVELSTASMHFVLEISTQAITAVKMDGYQGSRYTWKEAWANATGITPVEK